MAAYNKVEVSLNTNAVEVGIPSPQTVNVTIPTVGPAGPTGPQGPQGEPGEVSGSIAWDNVTDKPASFTPSAHKNSHATGGSDALTSADIGAATSAQGALADTAVQPGDLSTVATSGDYDDLSNKPASFTPSLHGSTHYTGGTDALAAHQINGQTIFSTSSATYSSDQTLTANRARQLTISNTNASGINVTLPTEADGTLVGDTYVLIGGNNVAGPITVRRINVISPLIYETLATISSTGEQYRFRASGGATGGWSLVPVDSHTHAASDITSGTLTHERGGLEADVSAYSGLVKIDAGTTSAVTVTAAGEALLDDADAAAQRTTLGLGNSATLDTGTTAGTVAAGDDARLSDSRTPSSHASSHAAGAAARFSGQVAGMTGNILIVADNVGTAGNSITLTFDGVDDISAVLTAWNSANPSNQASVAVGDDGQIPDNLEVITLSGGAAAGSDPITDPVFDSVGVGGSPVGSERKFHQHGGKFTVESDSGSYGQFQVVNPTAGEVTFVMASDGATETDGTLTATLPENIWAFGLGPYGNNPTDFCIGNNSSASVFHIKPDGKVGLGSSNVDPVEALDVDGNIAMRDLDNGVAATFDVQSALSADRTYTLPDASGVLALSGDAPASHTHGNLSNDGKIGSTAGLPLKTGTDGVVEAGAFGTGAGEFCEGDDARLSDARTPTAHTHAASDITSGTLTHERGGLEADVSAYDGLVKISGGSTSAVTLSSAGEALLDDADAAAQRTTLGLGNSATLDTGTTAGTVAAGDHTHELANLDATGATDGHVLTADGAGGAAWEAASGGDTVSIDTTAADVLTATSGAISADDGGTIDSSDPFIKWDDTAGKLVYANPLSRPSGAFYVGLAPTTTAIGTNSLTIVPARNNANQVASATDGIAIGRNARCTGAQGIRIGVGGLADFTASIAIGNAASTSGFDALALGSSSSASGARSSAVGNGTTASLIASFVTRPFSSIYWGGQTTNDTATVLNLDATAIATNRFTIAANTALAVDILLVARRSDTADKWLVARRFLGIRRDGSNNTSLIGSVQTLGTDQSDGSPTWSFTLTADDTNEALQLEVTGAASETVQWRATAFYRVV